MKAVWYDRQGPAQEVLCFGEMPTPEPGPGEVRVRLHASAVNPADANRRAGRLHGMDYPRVIPNSDGAGVIDAVGKGVDPDLLARRVWLHFGQRGRAFGTAAEFICLPGELAAPLPDQVDFIEGACLGIPAMTAYCSLFLDGPIEGKTVLVTGGAGAVGHYAVQLAKWGGARVVATVSSAAKAAHARRGGAHEVVDYTSDDVAERILDFTAGKGVDRIVDVDAIGNMKLGFQVAADHATWVSYAIGPDPAEALPMVSLIRRNLSLRGLYLSGMPIEVRRQAQRGIGRWLAEAPDAVHAVDRSFSLRDTAQAHLAVEARGKVGTVVVRCDWV